MTQVDFSKSRLRRKKKWLNRKRPMRRWSKMYSNLLRVENYKKNLWSLVKSTRVEG